MPERIGRFDVDRLLGSGTFATVWLARDADLNAPVAIKVLAENWSQSEDARRRFLDEARALRELDSDRIIRVYEVGRLDDGRPYMVTEFADLGNLQERMAARFRSGEQFTIDESAAIAVEIANCLTEAHDRRIIHRDLKPSNIMFRSVSPERQEAMRREGRTATTERMVLGDFGIARRLEGAVGATMVVGTPHYMAPEQADLETASQADERSDIYAAAVIFYELLAGRVPFPYESVGRVQRAQLEEEPPPIETLRAGVPAPLARVLRKGLERNPNDRFPTAREWRDALRVASVGGQPAAPAGTVVNVPTPGSAAPTVVPATATVVPGGQETITGGPGSPGGPTGGGGGGGGGGNGGPRQPASAPRPGGMSTRTKQIVAVVLLVALGVTGGVIFGTSRAQADTVTLEAKDATGSDPFYDPDAPPETPGPGHTVNAIPIFPTGTGAPEPSPDASNTSLPPEIAKVGSSLIGLYGGTGLNTQCDRNKLIRFLATHLDKATAWAKTMGVEIPEIPDFIRTKLVPVVLKVDARVTNHGFVNGAATAFQSILQAGSAVLVDLFGQPRVRCKCGNPLKPPISRHKRVKLIGTRWPGFSITTIININIPAVSTTAIVTQQPTPSPTPTPTPTPTPSPSTPTITDVSLSASATAGPSTPGYPAGNAIDDDFTTSWFSAGAKYGPTSSLTITLARKTTITRIEFFGNEHHPQFPTGFGFGSWVIALLDANGHQLYALKNTSPGMQSQKQFVPSVAGVVSIKFIGSDRESPDCGGFSELHAFGYAT